MKRDYSLRGWLRAPFVPLQTTVHFVLYCISSAIYNFNRCFYVICYTLVAHYFGATFAFRLLPMALTILLFLPFPTPF